MLDLATLLSSSKPSSRHTSAPMVMGSQGTWVPSDHPEAITHPLQPYVQQPQQMAQMAAQMAQQPAQAPPQPMVGAPAMQAPPPAPPQSGTLGALYQRMQQQQPSPQMSAAPPSNGYGGNTGLAGVLGRLYAPARTA